MVARSWKNGDLLPAPGKPGLRLPVGESDMGTRLSTAAESNNPKLLVREAGAKGFKPGGFGRAPFG